MVRLTSGLEMESILMTLDPGKKHSKTSGTISRVSSKGLLLNILLKGIRAMTEVPE
jgi:hypothetical protein